MPHLADRSERSLTPLAFLCLALLLFGRLSFAQDLLDTAPSLRGFSVRKEVNEVNVLFTASHKGKPVGNLAASNIVIQDDSKPPAAVVAFRTRRELPLRVGLVIDTSDSVTSRFHFEQDAASTFLSQAVESEDLGFALGFSDQLRLTQDFASDHGLLSKGVQRLSLGGGTALYDAILAACRKLVDRPERDTVARVLVVMSDGQNNAGKSKLDDAIGAAQEAGVTIFAVGTNYSTYSLEDKDPESEEGKKSLRKLADQTGGRALFPPDPKEVGLAFARIGDELRNRYEISYTPADFKPDGHYRKIEIIAHVSGQKLEVRARKGYLAKASASLVSNPGLVIHQDQQP